jgi:hypothetical protein
VKPGESAASPFWPRELLARMVELTSGPPASRTRAYDRGAPAPSLLGWGPAYSAAGAGPDRGLSQLRGWVPLHKAGGARTYRLSGPEVVLQSSWWGTRYALHHCSRPVLPHQLGGQFLWTPACLLWTESSLYILIPGPASESTASLKLSGQLFQPPTCHRRKVLFKLPTFWSGSVPSGQVLWWPRKSPLADKQPRGRLVVSTKSASPRARPASSGLTDGPFFAGALTGRWFRAHLLGAL